jgi:hypothetical protein
MTVLIPLRATCCLDNFFSYLSKHNHDLTLDIASQLAVQVCHTSEGHNGIALGATDSALLRGARECKPVAFSEDKVIGPIYRCYDIN